MKDIKPYVGRQVRVFTEFATLVGTLDRAGDPLVLSHAAVVADDGDETPLDGEVLLPVAQVQWMQVP